MTDTKQRWMLCSQCRMTLFCDDRQFADHECMGFEHMRQLDELAINKLIDPDAILPPRFSVNLELDE